MNISHCPCLSNYLHISHSFKLSLTQLIFGYIFKKKKSLTRQVQHRPRRPTKPLGGGAAETSKCTSLFHFNNGSPVTADPDSPQPDSCIGPHCHHIHNSFPVTLKLSLLLCCSTVRVCLIHYLRVRLPSSLFPQIPDHIKTSARKPL